MEIVDERGRRMGEVVVRLSDEEVTDLLVASASLDGEEVSHALVRSQDGTTLALYRETGEPSGLQRGTDWWLGPLVLVAVILLVVGAYTIGSGIVTLLF